MEKNGLSIAEIDTKWRAMGPSERERWKSGRPHVPANVSHAASSTTRARPSAPSVSSSESSDENFTNMEAVAEEKWSLFTEGKSLDDLKKTRFVAMSFNVALKWKGKFYPNEIGAAIYSFNNGIDRDPKHVSRFHRDSVFHKHIYPGALPPGSYYLALGHQHRHKISIDEPLDHAVGRSSSTASDAYYKMLDELLDFIRPTAIEIGGTKYYFIFVKGNLVLSQVAQVFGSITFLAETCKHATWLNLLRLNRILVLDISYLALSALQSAFVEGAFLIAPSICDSTTFDYQKDISCQFHEENECNFCAQAVAIKLWYVMSESLIKPLEIKPIANQHLPKTHSSHTVEESQVKSDEDEDENENASERFSAHQSSAIRQSEYCAIYPPLSANSSFARQASSATYNPSELPTDLTCERWDVTSDNSDRLSSRASTICKSVAGDVDSNPGLTNYPPRVRGAGRGKGTFN